MPRLRLRRKQQQEQSTASSPAEVAAAGDPPDGAECTPTAMSGRVSPVSERRHSLRVLLVDDNSASQQAMRRIITNAGMLCDLAGNGKEAIAVTELMDLAKDKEDLAASYHLVLMDLAMPEMDGATATRLLRDKEAEQGRRRLPVIGICATLTNQAACIAAGMDAWQGRTLLHFLAHPETTQCIPRKVLTLS
jgi:CheY-like chemotaxis protein